jgi:hypothetical protein
MSVQISDIIFTVCFSVTKFNFQLHHLVSEVSTSLTFYIVQFVVINLAWIQQRFLFNLLHLL